MAAPVGNKNAVKNRPWADSLKRALARMADGSIDKGLDKIADKVVAAALEGDKDAWQEIANRLDGKPIQAVATEDGSPFVIQLVRFGDHTATSE